jgi:hypothetical protein
MAAMPPPRFAPSVVVGDDALLLAEIATLIAKRSAYLPVLNGPRLQRPDPDHEVIRFWSTGRKDAEHTHEGPDPRVQMVWRRRDRVLVDNQKSAMRSTARMVSLGADAALRTRNASPDQDEVRGDN